jgi:hypothetical protein
MNPSIFVSVAKEPGLSTSERESIRYDIFVQKLLKPLPEQLNALHIAVGLAGEFCEYLDADEDNIIEELGDIEFYLQAAHLHYGTVHSECLGVMDSRPPLYQAIGNLVDLIKKEYIYNKPRDLHTIQVALGEVQTALVLNYNYLDTTRQEILQANALKLEKRYAGLYYSDEAAQARADKT